MKLRDQKDSNCNLFTKKHIKQRNKKERNKKTLKKWDKNNHILIHTKFKSLDEQNNMVFISSIQFGKYKFKPIYPSPYPYNNSDILYICEKCFGYTIKKRYMAHHYRINHISYHYPGPIIYEETQSNSISIHLCQVDGEKNEIFCQNLCLFSKLFLDQKTLYFNVGLFWFYILYVKNPDESISPVGYFSKEKNSPEGYNLSCIVIFPPYQRQGYGSFLISISYELTKRQGIVGTPERPLSKLGYGAYLEYWKYSIYTYLTQLRKKNITLLSLSQNTGIMICDIIQILNLKCYNHSKNIFSIDFNDIVSTRIRRIRICQPNLLKWKPTGKEIRL